MKKRTVLRLSKRWWLCRWSSFSVPQACTAGAVGRGSSGCGKPPAVRDYRCFCATMPTGTTASTALPCSRWGKGMPGEFCRKGCEQGSPFALIPLWPEVAVSEVTPSLGFYGLRDTAWAGRIRVQSRAGEWLIIVSDGGRIRMCQVSQGAMLKRQQGFSLTEVLIATAISSLLLIGASRFYPVCSERCYCNPASENRKRRSGRDCFPSANSSSGQATVRVTAGTRVVNGQAR